MQCQPAISFSLACNWSTAISATVDTGDVIWGVSLPLLLFMTLVISWPENKIKVSADLYSNTAPWQSASWEYHYSLIKKEKRKKKWKKNVHDLLNS